MKTKEKELVKERKQVSSLDSVIRSLQCCGAGNGGVVNQKRSPVGREAKEEDGVNDTKKEMILVIDERQVSIPRPNGESQRAPRPIRRSQHIIK